ncbi:portal protein [Zavarzinia sp. CC-PAN008]|uniref:portal protein n=1 Tax=Zavarzinia sp. CC-PAN008 TaxID=3243332 RepID=UPI003F74987A
MTEALGKRLCGRFDELEAERKTWETHWQEVSDFVLPRRDFTTTRTPGEKRSQRQVDGTTPAAAEQLANALHGTATSPWLKWFELRPEDEDLAEDDEVAAWLEDATRRMHNVFSAGSSGFGPAAHEFYLDYTALATSCFYVGERTAPSGGALTDIQFASRPLAECFIAEDADGRVDTLFRKFCPTARQARQMFGDAAGRRILELAEKKPGEKVTLLHATLPREDARGDGVDPKTKPVASVYVDRESGHVIREGGYDEMPFLAARWSKRSGEIYGYGPGMIALPDTKMLNAMATTTIRAAQRSVDPPMQMPDDGYVTAANLRPGAMNYYRSGVSQFDRIAPILTGADPRIGMEMMNEVRQRIRETFYVEWLKLPELDRMTATEVIERRDQRLRLLSPMLTRLEAEFLSPLIDRVFDILMRRGRFLPVPQALRGRSLKVEYVAPIAAAQRATEAESINRLLVLAAQVAQVNPQAIQAIDAEQTLRIGARLYGSPRGLIRSPAMVASIMAETQQRQAMAAAVETGQGIAAGAKDAAQAARFLQAA